jgi:hypothetical protein
VLLTWLLTVNRSRRFWDKYWMSICFSVQAVLEAC